MWIIDLCSSPSCELTPRIFYWTKYLIIPESSEFVIFSVIDFFCFFHYYVAWCLLPVQVLIQQICFQNNIHTLAASATIPGISFAVTSFKAGREFATKTTYKSFESFILFLNHEISEEKMKNTWSPRFHGAVAHEPMGASQEQCQHQNYLQTEGLFCMVVASYLWAFSFWTYQNRPPINKEKKR